MTEGVDYSSTPWSGSPSASVLLSNQKYFVGRYAVNDKSPGGRGINAAEYTRMVQGGIDVFLYWEGQNSWMLGGWQAGVNAALNAQQNLVAAGIPPATPIYFAHDIEPEERHFAAIDDCLAGAASVIGLNRVGIYGGWGIIDHCSRMENATFKCQTAAWSGDGHGGIAWHPAAHLHQYGFNAYFDGTNCDLVRATVPNYGQAIPPDVLPRPKPYAKIWLPEGWEEAAKDPHAAVFTTGDYKFRRFGANLKVKTLTTRRSKPDALAPVSGPKYDPGFKIHSQFLITKKGVKGYYVQDHQNHYVLGSKLSPKFTVESW